MKKLLFSILLVFSLSPLFSQDKPAYQLYDAEGKKVKYAKCLKALEKAEIVLFGEIHNDPIAHWLQLETTKDLHRLREGKVMMGMEMFERDNQLLLEEYLGETISEKYFEEEAKLWSNYKTDYKPLVLFAKAEQIPLIGTNIPRRYANVVFHQGIEKLEDLSEEAKSYIAPLPIEVDLDLTIYREMLEMMGGHGSSDDSNSNFPNAQAIKDATMAWFISKHMLADHLFIHYHGAFHSEHGEGINWYLQKYRPNTQALTITTVYQADISQLEKENRDKADFIICVPENMSKTH